MANSCRLDCSKHYVHHDPKFELYDEVFFQNGLYHNVSGPAVIYSSGGKYWLNGIQYSKEEWQTRVLNKNY